MSKIKSPTPELRLAHWAVIILVALAIPVAVYAMMTWDDSDSIKKSVNSATSDLKVNSGQSSPSDINNNATPAQSATTTEGGQNMQPSAPSMPGTNYNYDYPPNPNPCPRGNRDIACIQQ